MKSNVLLVFLIALITIGLSEAWANVTPPDWSEFYSPRKTFSPRLFNRQAKQHEDAIYWATRKNIFENELMNCGSASVDDMSLNTCYNQVRKIETEKTAQYRKVVASERIQRSDDFAHLWAPGFSNAYQVKRYHCDSSASGGKTLTTTCSSK